MILTYFEVKNGIGSSMLMFVFWLTLLAANSFTFYSIPIRIGYLVNEYFRFNSLNKYSIFIQI